MNSAVGNVDIARPLIDILWYAILDDAPSTHIYEQSSPIVDNCWSESGDRKMVLFDLLIKEKHCESWETEYWDGDHAPLSPVDSRNNVLNALSYIPSRYPKNIGPMLYFVAETSDAKFDSIKADIATLYDSVKVLSLQYKELVVDLNAKEWMCAERRYMENTVAQMREDMAVLREAAAATLLNPKQKNWVGTMFNGTTVIVGMTICFIWYIGDTKFRINTI